MTTLDHLITSRTLVRVIHHFCNYHQPLSLRQIARRIKEDAANTHRAIERLEKAGLITYHGEGYDKTYVPVESYALDCLRELAISKRY